MIRGRRNVQKRRPVGRGENVRTAVLAATIEELAEYGCAALTIENVAHRAGVHKTTVYRRWVDRERLVLDALTSRIADEIPVPDSGTIDEALHILARSLVEMLNSTFGRAVISVLLSDALNVPEIAHLRQLVFEDRFHRAAPAVRSAIERGEIPGDTDPEKLIKTLIAPIYFHHLIAGEQIDEQTADHAAEVALLAARSGLLSR